jgi:hypothetical protein
MLLGLFSILDTAFFDDILWTVQPGRGDWGFFGLYRYMAGQGSWL